jgi:uncharacterized damage-inducible protein DinB
MLTIADLLKELEQEAQSTRRVLERVPSDRLDWRPHRKSMTLGELAMHVADLPGVIVEVSTRNFDANTVIPRPGASSTAELLAVLEGSVKRAKAQLRTMTDADLALPWRMLNGERELWSVSRGELLRSVMLNHWYHHRGQLTVYLRLVEVPLPAIYGDSADESAFTPANA